MWLAYRAQSSAIPDAPDLRVDGLLHQLRRPALRPADRPVPALAAHPGAGVPGGARLPPHQLVPLQHRHLPLDDDLRPPSSSSRRPGRETSLRRLAAPATAPRTRAAPSRRGPGAAPTRRSRPDASPGRVEAVVMAMLALHVLFQALFPFRHLLYPGDVAWTEEGHRFAWRMKLRAKSHTTTYFALVPSTGATWQLQPRDYLTECAGGRDGGTAGHGPPARALMADRLRQQGYQDVEVYVRALTSLNGRRRRDLIDPNANLAAKERSIWPADWLAAARRAAPAPRRPSPCVRLLPLLDCHRSPLAWHARCTLRIAATACREPPKEDRRCPSSTSTRSLKACTSRMPTAIRSAPSAPSISPCA